MRSRGVTELNNHAKHAKKARKPVAQVLLAFIVAISTAFALSLTAITLDQNPLGDIDTGAGNEITAPVETTEPSENAEPTEPADETGDEENQEEELMTPEASTAISNAAGFANIANGGSFYLSQDITVTNGVTINNKTTNLDLNGHIITANIGNNGVLITLTGDNAKLTISDGGSGATIDKSTVDGKLYGEPATYSNKKLTYYVAESAVNASSNNGATTETWKKYVVSGAGMIAGNNACRCIYMNNNKCTLNIDGGYITNFNATNCTSGDGNLSGNGAAVACTGGTINMSGGVIAGNKAKQGAGISVFSYSTNAVLNMTGGVISGNTVTDAGNLDQSRGGAGIQLGGSVVSANISGGYITCNRSEYKKSANGSGGYHSGGAGIRVAQQSKCAISGGYITGNYAVNGGGGLFLYDNGKVTMTGGTLASNKCKESEGGGINIGDNSTMTITAANGSNIYINNNIIGDGINDTVFYDWGGGGIFCTNNSGTLIIKNALITENRAGGFGGGVAGCSTGRITMSQNAGAAIFENDAADSRETAHVSGQGSSKSEDHQYALDSDVFMNNGYQDYFCALASKISGEMLGGGAAMWSGSSDGQAVATTNKTDIIEGTYVTGLTCEAGDDAKSAARTKATVFMNGNESPTHGGAILVNGHMIVGEVDKVVIPARIELGAKKRMYDEDGKIVALTDYKFKFKVEDEHGIIVSEATNNEAGQLEFDRRLAFSEPGTYKYYLTELPYEEDPTIITDTSRYEITIVVEETSEDWDKVPGTDIKRTVIKVKSVVVKNVAFRDAETVYNNTDVWNDESHAINISSIIGDKVFENRKIAANTPESVTVEKSWAGGEPKSGGIKVALFEDGVKKEEQTLTKAGGWTYTWNGLTNDHNYTVKEVGENDYYADYSSALKYSTVAVTGNDYSAKLYVKNGSNFEATNSLVEGKEYIIVSGDGTKALYISSGHEDAVLTSADVKDVTQSGGKYAAASIDTRCVFKAVMNQDGSKRLMLANQGTASWLLVQESGGKYLKGTSAPDWSSGFKMTNDGGNYYLQGHKEFVTDQGNWRYVIWNGSVFDTDTSHTESGSKVDKVMKFAEIENTPLKDVRFTLNLQKYGGGVKRPLADAEFILKDDKGQEVARGNTAVTGHLIFTELPAGTYTLSEVNAPEGFLLCDDQTIVLGKETPNKLCKVEITDKREGEEEDDYELPKTGGPGTLWCYLMGVVLIALALVNIYTRKDKRL